MEVKLKLFRTIIFSLLLVLPVYPAKSMNIPITIGTIKNIPLVWEVLKAGVYATAIHWAQRKAIEQENEILIDDPQKQNTHTKFKPNLYDRGIPQPKNVYQKYLSNYFDSIKTHKDIVHPSDKTKNIYLNSDETQTPQLPVISGNNPIPQIDPDDERDFHKETQEILDLIKQVSKKLETADSTTKIKNVFSNQETAEKIKQLIKAIEIVSTIGDIYNLDWWHIICGDLEKGCITGLHADLYELISKSGLFEITDICKETNIKDIITYSRKLNHPISKNIPSKLTTVITGGWKTFIAYYKEAADILTKDWDKLVTPNIKKDGIVRRVEVTLKNDVQFVFRNINTVKKTIQSAYPIAKKLSMFAIGVAIVSGVMQAFNHESNEEKIEPETTPNELETSHNELENLPQNLPEIMAMINQKIKDGTFFNMLADNSSETLSSDIEKAVEVGDAISLEIPKIEKTKIDPFALNFDNKFLGAGQTILNYYELFKKEGESLREKYLQPAIKTEFTATYRYEELSFEDMVAEYMPSMKQIIRHRIYNHPNSEFSLKFISYMRKLESILLSTNTINKTGEPIDFTIARYLMLYLEPYNDYVGTAFQRARDLLLDKYFEKDGSPKYSPNSDASKIIADYLKEVAFNQPHYRTALKEAVKCGLFETRNIFHKEKNIMIDQSYFDQEPTKLPGDYLDKLNIVRNHPVNLLYKDVINCLIDSEYEQAWDLIQKANICIPHHKSVLTQMYRTYFYKQHNKYGINSLFNNDPYVQNLSEEQLMEISASYEKIHKFNYELAQRHTLANMWQFIFGIDNKSITPKLHQYLYSFACSSHDHEKAIDSLMDLSADSEENQEIFAAFFNEQGILKNLARKPVLKQFTISDVIATKQGTELRKYLNYFLTFHVNQDTEPRISLAIENILLAAQNLNNESYENYLNEAKRIYQSLEN